MMKPMIALVSMALLGISSPLLAAQGPGGSGYVAGSGWGGGHAGGRPAYVSHYGHGGWHGGYWGPRVGIYYGGPGYWAGWPWGWGVWPGAWGPAYAYGYGTAPIVVYDTAQPQQFIQQEPAPGAAAQVAPEASYWFYCTQPAGYFPYVKECSQPWLKVVPQPPSEQPTAPRVAP